MLIYRNEAMDATHLAEFFQVEGVVADYDITLGNLVGMSFFLSPFFGLFITPVRCRKLINSVHGGVLCEDGK
jgi:phenylalanyl-tRNA synthetase alpha subunit